MTSIGLDSDLALNRRRAVIWINADLILWCIYAALGGGGGGGGGLTISSRDTSLRIAAVPQPLLLWVCSKYMNLIL